jgi:hypothetical protein
VLSERFEKIQDLKHQRHYYYDRLLDVSSWIKPALLRGNDLLDAPIFTQETGAVLIQKYIRRMLALQRVRGMYDKVVTRAVDEGSGVEYYWNILTGVSMWQLPAFMVDRQKIEVGVEHGAQRIEDSDSDFGEEDVQADESFRRPGRSATMPLLEDVNALSALGTVTYRMTNTPRHLRIDEGRRGGLEEYSSLDMSHSLVRRVRLHPRSVAQWRVDQAEDIESATELNLSHLGASSISGRVFDLVALNTLDLSHNKLRELSSDIQYLPRLRSLDISHNYIASIPVEIEELRRIEVFNAASNQLSSLPGHFFKLREMQELDISSNPFTIMPIEIGSLELLKELREWEVSIGLFSKLRVLRMHHCMVEEWPKQLERLEELLVVDLGHNQIKKIPAHISLNGKLRELHLASNHLYDFPSELYGLPLQILVISSRSFLK